MLILNTVDTLCMRWHLRNVAAMARMLSTLLANEASVERQVLCKVSLLPPARSLRRLDLGETWPAVSSMSFSLRSVNAGKARSKAMAGIAVSTHDGP